MALSTTQNSINRLQKDLADLQKKISDEKSKEAAINSKLNRAQQALSKAKTSSTLNSKISEINRLNNDLTSSSKKQADLQKKVAGKNKELLRHQQQFSKEQASESKKQVQAQEKLQRDQLEYQKKITRELEEQKRLVQQTAQVRSNTQAINDEVEVTTVEYDVFISHASEDKEDFVRPLAEELIRLGVKVWYDEISIGWGNSLRQSIDKGLANSKYGIIVISSTFINKRWPAYEVDGLVAREMEGGTGVILPIWHKVTKSEVIRYSPSLADKLALNSSVNSIEEIADQLKQLLL
ncbi:toll/interleukin-1 receptor domain-containing protein [Paenibacillus sp. 276b]|uniref:toll/interleukin-1 receptor domain-containing protein n=1 Tax=Paenibacillus sp. 276b TaxID=1566277 RepID=UPI00089C857E|nr:toll/interleukin-1 receptor domain-containing protein [Paenibacillus sp. 276b]SEB27502.1 TIR domain-containing protein [Paenibacillus sp. 276b]